MCPACNGDLLERTLSSEREVLDEVIVAATWWATALSRADRSLGPEAINAFRNTLAHGIRRRIAGHWYPEDPMRGQGYRALVCAESTDGLLLDAADAAGVGASNFRTIFPSFTYMFLDPGNVTYRHGNFYEKQIFPPSLSSAVKVH